MTVPQLSPAPELTEAEKATVERVARAIGSESIGVTLVTDDEWCFYLRPDEQDYFRMLAIAALTALRGDRAPLAGQHTTDEEEQR